MAKKTIPSPFPAYVQAAKRGERDVMSQELPWALRTPETTAKLVEWAAMWSPLALDQLVETVPEKVSEHLDVVVMRAVERGELSTLTVLAPLLAGQPQALAHRIMTTRDPSAVIKAAFGKAVGKTLSERMGAATKSPTAKDDAETVKQRTPVEAVEAPNPAWRRLFEHLVQGKTPPPVSAAMGDILLTWAPAGDRAKIVAQGMATVLGASSPTAPDARIQGVLVRWARSVGPKDVWEALQSTPGAQRSTRQFILNNAGALLGGISSRQLLTQTTQTAWGQDTTAFDEEAAAAPEPPSAPRRQKPR